MSTYYLFIILLVLIGQSYCQNSVPFSTINYLYVEPGCTSCAAKTYPSIKQALDVATPYSTIILKDGTFQGDLNTDIEITTPFVRIRSVNGKTKSIIDCQNVSYFIKVVNAQEFSLSGVSVQNCVGNKGGAIQIKNSFGTFSNVGFNNNKATNGAAIYSHNSKVEITNCAFTGNKVLHDGAAIYSYLSKVNIQGDASSFSGNNDLNPVPLGKDILCKNSTITIGSQVPFTTASFQCLEGCDSSYSNKAICQNNFYKAASSATCGNGLCEPNESCLTCPNECSCHIGGLILEKFEDGCSIEAFSTSSPTTPCVSKKNSTLTSPRLENFMGGMKNIVVRMFGYINVETSQDVPFTFQGGHFGLSFKINAQQQFFFNQATRFNETKVVYLTDRHSHFIEIILFSNNPDGSQRSFNLLPFADNNIRLFYSNLVCGDGISNINEKSDLNSLGQPNKFYCPYDSKYPTFNDVVKCGDGICNENPNSCFQDCYQEMTKTCPTRQVPEGHISPGFYFSGDTLGDIISNQFIWRLPGSEHLSYGVDILTGNEAPAPLFQFDYCSNIASNVIEDPYRGNVYQIPPEFHGKAYPQCTYSTSTESFESETEMSKEMEKKSSFDFSANVGGSYSFISGNAAVGFSQEKGIKESRKISMNNKQTIFKTDLYCRSSYVEMDLNKVSLHPSLLNELANVKDASDMVALVRKRGTHFYKKTYLGGKLTQISITESTNVRTENKDEWTESVSGSFSASVSSPTFSVSGSVSAAVDKSQSEQQQQDKQEESTISRMMVYGGIPAAFSPAEDGQSSPGFKEWASSIDVLPVPVDYQLYPIKMLLNSLWVNKHGVNIRALWEEAEISYYNGEAFFNEGPNPLVSYSLIYQFEISSPILNQTYWSSSLSPILDITYYVVENGAEATKNLKIPIEFQYTNCKGEMFVSDFVQDNTPAGRKEGVITAFYLNTPNPAGTQYRTFEPHPTKSLKYPLKFDFRTVDFFLSTKKPIIKITLPTGFPPLQYEPSKIISWKTYKAILFFSSSAGVISTPTNFYATAAFENYWSYNATSRYVPYGTMSGYPSSNTVPFTCTDEHHGSEQCIDGIEFQYRGPSVPISSSDPRPKPIYDPINSVFYPKDFRLSTPSRAWLSFSNPIPPTDYPKDLFYVENFRKIGINSRVNWLKIYFPNTNDPWRFDILTYHINNEKSIYDSANYINTYFADNTDLTYKFFKLESFGPTNLAEKQLYFYHNYNYNGGIIDSYEYFYQNAPYYSSIQGKNSNFDVFEDLEERTSHRFFKKNL